MLSILIAVDGSEPSRRAIEAAARLAAQAGGAQVVLLNVIEGPGYYGELPPFDHASIMAALRAQQAALLEAALAQARLSGLDRVETAAATGPAAQEIVREASTRGVDQIVMGTRGMSVLGGLLLGSVAQRVVHGATCPVLLVK